MSFIDELLKKSKNKSEQKKNPNQGVEWFNEIAFQEPKKLPPAPLRQVDPALVERLLLVNQPEKSKTSDAIAIQKDPNTGVDWFNSFAFKGVPSVDPKADYRAGYQGKSELPFNPLDSIINPKIEPKMSKMMPSQRDAILPARAKAPVKTTSKLSTKEKVEVKTSAPAQEAIQAAATEAPQIATTSTSPESDSVTDSLRNDFMAMLGRRGARLDRLEAERAALAEKEPSGLFAANLSPLMMFLDEMYGSKMAHAYQAPTAKEEWQARMNKLDENFEKGADSLTADQIAYVLSKDKDSFAKNLNEDGQLHDVDMEALKHKYNMEELKFKAENGLNKNDDAFNQWLRMEQLKLAQQGQAIQQQQFSESRKDRKDKELDNDVERASKRLEGWAKIKPVFARVARYATMPTEEVPGYQNLGQAVKRRFLPNMYQSKEYQEIVQDVSFLAQQYLQDTSGMSTTEQENLRTLANIGAKPESSARSLQEGIDLIITMGLKKAKQIESGYRPEVKQRFKQQGGELPSDFQYKREGGYPKTLTKIDENGKKLKAQVRNAQEESEAVAEGWQ